MGERPAPEPGVDPLFTEEDTVEILDFLADEHLLCPGCGEPLAESTSIDNEWTYRAFALSCHACAAKSRAMRKPVDRDGLYAFLEPPRR